jgi:transposase InsO family protein
MLTCASFKRNSCSAVVANPRQCLSSTDCVPPHAGRRGPCHAYDTLINLSEQRPDPLLADDARMPLPQNQAAGGAGVDVPYGIARSMSRSENVWDNAAMESFFSSLKIEGTARNNLKRRHSKIGYLSPMEFEMPAGLT